MQRTVGRDRPGDEVEGATDRAPQPPPRPDFSMRPALIVGALAVVILVVFSVGAALTKTAAPPTTTPQGPTAVTGSSLRATSARHGLAVIERAGQPPTNVLAAITLPAGARRESFTDLGAGGTYDREVQFSVDASEAAVLDFYRAELRGLGWRTVTSGPASHQAGQQVVGQIAGDDGYYWQLGVIVSPSTFPAGGTLDQTRFTLRVLQVGDEN